MKRYLSASIWSAIAFWMAAMAIGCADSRSNNDTGRVKTFASELDQIPYAVKETADGGFIIVGSSNASDGKNELDTIQAVNLNIFLVRTNANGDSMWQHTIGSNANDVGYAVQETAQGEFIIVGSSDSLGAGSDVYLVKTGVDGVVLWEKVIEGPGDEVGYAVQIEPDQGYMITGETEGANYFILKTDVDGNKEWEKTFLKSSSPYFAKRAKQTSDGGLIIAEHFSSLDPECGGGNCVLIRKTDDIDNVLWDFYYYCPVISGCSARSLQETSNGNFIIAMHAWRHGGIGYLYLLKTDSDGNILWEKQFSTFFEEEYVHPAAMNSLLETMEGDYVIVSYATNRSLDDLYHNQVYIACMDADGNNLWRNTFGDGSYDRGKAVFQTSDGELVIVGHTSPTDDPYDQDFDIFILKTDSEGNRVF